MFNHHFVAFKQLTPAKSMKAGKRVFVNMNHVAAMKIPRGSDGEDAGTRLIFVGDTPNLTVVETVEEIAADSTPDAVFPSKVPGRNAWL